MTDGGKSGVGVIAAALGWMLLMSCHGDNGFREASGTLEAVEIRVSSQVSGVVREVMPDEGEHVNEGDVLVILDDVRPSLMRDQARGARDAARAALELVLEGARIEDRDQAREALASADESLRLAQEEAARLHTLFASGSVSKQALDRADSAVTQAETARARAASAVTRIEAGARSAEVDAARAALDQAEAALALAGKTLSDTRITAPAGGTVLYRLIEPGETAPAGVPVFVIADLERLRLTVYVPEPDLPRIRLGQMADIRMDGTDRTVEGRVSWISPVAEFTPKNVQTRDERVKQVFAVRLDVANPDGLVKPGMPADAIFGTPEEG